MKIKNSFLITALSACIVASAMAAPTSTKVHVEGVNVPPSANATLISPMNPSQMLQITVALNPSSEKALKDYVDATVDPESPFYHQWLTPEQVGAQFGASPKSVAAVVNYLKSHGLKIELVAKNNMAITASGTAAQISAAFNTSIANYKGTGQNGKPIQFFANSKELSLPASIAGPVLVVSGLSSYMRPIRRNTLTPAMSRGCYGTAPSYANGIQGQGMTLGYANYDGYDVNNAIAFITQFSLPYPGAGKGTNVHTIDIVNGQNNSGTTGGGEGDLDMQMELSVAPLATINVYDNVNGDALSTYTRIANDNVANIVSESYGWGFGSGNNSYATACDNEIMTMNSQGQSYCCASGDNGTGELATYNWPDVDPHLTVVGGTMATVDNQNQRSAEVTWSGSTGGWYVGQVGTTNFNTLPSWQKGTGVPTNVNERLSPDVALQSQYGNNSAFYIYYQGQLTTIAGTSCASPWFAGGITTMEQRLIANGQSGRLGNLNPMIYSQNGRNDVWFDITSGSSNGTLPNGHASVPTTGWDFITGWGAPKFDGWYNALATQTIAPTAFSVAPGILKAGNLASLATIDTNYLQIQPGPTINQNVSPCQLTVSSVSPLTTASKMVFSVTAHGSTGTDEYIYLYNYSTGKYDLLQTVTMTGTDQTINVTASSPNNYIQTGTLAIKSLITYRQVGPTISFPWNEYVNQTAWKITP